MFVQEEASKEPEETHEGTPPKAEVELDPSQLQLVEVSESENEENAKVKICAVEKAQSMAKQDKAAKAKSAAAKAAKAKAAKEKRAAKAKAAKEKRAAKAKEAKKKRAAKAKLAAKAKAAKAKAKKYDGRRKATKKDKSTKDAAPQKKRNAGGKLDPVAKKLHSVSRQTVSQPSSLWRFILAMGNIWKISKVYSSAWHSAVANKAQAAKEARKMCLDFKGFSFDMNWILSKLIARHENILGGWWMKGLRIINWSRSICSCMKKVVCEITAFQRGRSSNPKNRLTTET